MYQLTLSYEERRAIDWIGDRYAHGEDLYWWLTECKRYPDYDWDERADITFLVPEYIAWEIDDIGVESYYMWDCFSDKLKNKLNDFCNSIV